MDQKRRELGRRIKADPFDSAAFVEYDGIMRRQGYIKLRFNDIYDGAESRLVDGILVQKTNGEYDNGDKYVDTVDWLYMKDIVKLFNLLKGDWRIGKNSLDQWGLHYSEPIDYGPGWDDTITRAIDDDLPHLGTTLDEIGEYAARFDELMNTSLADDLGALGLIESSKGEDDAI